MKLFNCGHSRTAGVLLPLSLALIAGGAEGLQGQSIFSSAGALGAPTQSVDARARMLGGITVGMKSVHWTPTDPAGAADFILPTIAATSEISSESEDGGPVSGRTRFPAFGIAYPYRATVITFGFNGVLSQDWETEVLRSISFGDGREVEAFDRFSARGGISALSLGVARRIAPNVSVGVSGGLLLGSVTYIYTRELSPVDVGSDVELFVDRGFWQSDGQTATASVNWDVSPLLRVGGGVTWNGDLTLRPAEGSTSNALEVSLPLTVRVGAEGTLSPGLSMAASWSRADWSSAAETLDDANAPGVVSEWGTGLEWARGQFRGRPMPLALGYQSRDLPFTFLGDPVSERGVTGGIGVHLVDSEAIPLARAFLSVERGTRDAGARSEAYWRTSVSLRISSR
jgi:hypothetical protein